MAYDAFISYNHDADATLAPLLQSHLQRFAKPWWRRRALSVFRDNASLSANPGLWTSITKAMDDSRYFVLLASPDAAASPWVAKEIEYWRATKPEGTLLPVLTEGEWEWDDAAGTFDWERSTAVPAALASVYTEEPRHVDLRWARAEEQLDLRHARFRTNIVELAAPIHGKPREDMEGEDVRQYRRTRRVVVAAVLALALLATSTGIGAVVAATNATTAQANERRALSEAERAEQNAQLARENEQRAQDNAERAEQNEATAQENERRAQENADQAAANQLDAERNAAEAAEFAQQAADNADEAVRNEGIALRNQRTAERNEAEAEAQRGRAEGQTRLAEGQTRLATGRQLAAQARLDLDGPVDRGILLALEAYGTEALPEAASGVVAATQRTTGLRRVLYEHEEVVFTSATSPDGRTLATGSVDGSIRLYDVAAGVATGPVLRAPTRSVRGLEFSPDGRLLAAASDSAIQLWDTATWAPVGDPIPDDDYGTGDPTSLQAHGLVFTPDGTRIVAFGGSNLVRFIDVATRTQADLPIPVGEREIRAFAANLTGIAAAGSDDGTITLFYADPARAPVTLTGHTDGITSLTFLAGTQFLFSGSDDGTARLWDADLGVPYGVPFVGHEAPVTGVAVGPDGFLLATTSRDRTIRLWDGLTQKQLGVPLSGHSNWVADAAFTPDGTLASVGWDSTVRLWSTADRQAPLRHGDGITDPPGVRDVGYSADGTVLVTGDEAGMVRLWDPVGRTLLRTLPPLGGVVTSVALSPNGRSLAAAVGSPDGIGTVQVWDTGGGGLIGTLPAEGDDVEEVVYSPDGRDIVTGSTGGIVRFFGARDLAPRGFFRILGDQQQEIGGPINGLAFSRGGALAIVGTGLFYKASLPAPPIQLGTLEDFLANAGSGLAISPDGTTLVTGSLSGLVTVWDVLSRSVRAGPFKADVGAVRNLEFTPDGATFVTSGDVGAIRFWDTVTGEAVGIPVPVHGVRVDGLAFSPDGSQLASAGSEGLVQLSPAYLYDRDVPRQRDRLCAAVGRNLTQAEWRRFLGAQPYRRTCAQWPAGG